VDRLRGIDAVFVLLEYLRGSEDSDVSVPKTKGEKESRKRKGRPS